MVFSGNMISVIEDYFLITFRFLEDMPSGETFIAFAFIIRIVEAIGSASTQVAILSVMSITFKDNISTVFVRMRLFYLIMGKCLHKLCFLKITHTHTCRHIRAHAHAYTDIIG